MSAYVVMLREKTTNAEELKTYTGLARASFAGHAVTPIVRYGSFEMLEGDPIEGVAIIQFPTLAEAKAWYNSPASQKAAAHRWDGSRYLDVVDRSCHAACAFQPGPYPRAVPPLPPLSIDLPPPTRSPLNWHSCPIYWGGRAAGTRAIPNSRWDITD
jgi:uncharacterized protein (DUF1330 family)